MRLVFISSVTAMTPLRTISVTTGSMPRGVRFILRLQAICRSPHRSSWGALSINRRRCRGPTLASIGPLRLPKLGIIMPKMGIKQRPANGLAGALFSKVQLSVLGLLIGQPDRSFRISEIIRIIGSGSGAVQRELEALTAAGIFTVSSTVSQKLYRANRQSPIFEELYGLVLKTVGLVEPLQKALKPYRPNIDVAFVYGSVAKGTDTAKSDIDLMIIGEDISYADIFAALQSAEKNLYRPIHPNLMTVDDWRKQRANKSAFVTKIAEQPKMFVIGTDHELQGIG